MAQIHTFIQSAWQHLRADRPKQAMDCAKKAHAISPNSPDVAHLLGLLASRDGKPEIALPLLQKAIDTGGKTPQRLRHIAEALLDAGHPQVALAPLNDAIREFGESSDIYGLKSAIEIALEQWDNVAKSAQKAIDLNPSLMAWELNLSFAQLMQGKIEDGFKNATARPENLKVGSFCPALNMTSPCEVWLKGEQSVGALFYLRYVPVLVKQGWQFHLEADRKLVPLLQNTALFLSVKEKNTCPKNQVSVNVGDLPLMALQCGIKEIPPPLPLIPDTKLVEKYKQELAKIGPPPYIAVTWRGGPKGRKHRAGIRALEKFIDPTLLGGVLANSKATILSLQRLPEPDEAQALYQALGRKPADYSALNNNLAGMLALLSIVDEYVTVSNTNLHLREGLAKSSQVFVNRPFQDWRWQAEGNQSIWYPNSQVYRQDKDKSWSKTLTELNQYLSVAHFHQRSQLENDPIQEQHITTISQSSNTIDIVNTNKHTELIKDGWDIVASNIPEAINKARTVLVENPQHPRALHLLGWAAVQDLKFDLAISVLAQAVQLEPNNGNIWRDFIRAHVLLDKCHEAINIAQNCLTNPNLWATGVVHFAMGVAYARLGEDLKALENYELCMSLLPNHMESMDAAGMLRQRLGEHYARLGFKYSTARTEARSSNFLPYWTCPVLKGDVKGLKVLIVRSMGFGDELSYLRYLPYLIKAGADVTYWSGVKLVPLLERLPYAMKVIPDTEPMPDPASYDIAFIKNELPIAVEHLGAPEIADPLPLVLNQQKLEYWKNWLNEQGPAPYIGVTWRAGVAGKVKDGVSFTRLSKKVEPTEFVKALSGVNATWVSLQRNITKDELNAFEILLDSPIIDVAGLTDDLDDLLCIQYLLNENIGVSNTNMHIRASLGLGSRVLVSYPSTDWRWGNAGNQSVWFKQSKVYRQGIEGDWQAPFNELRKDLIEKYGLSQKKNKKLSTKKLDVASKTKKIIWVTAGEIKNGPDGHYSPLASAQERVVNVANLLAKKGWQSSYLNENISELMGGWHDKLPVKGDVVVFSKVFTDHAITLMHDARARGATVVFDVFNDFRDQPQRALHQQKMLEATDYIVSTPTLKTKWDTQGQVVHFYFPNVQDDLDPSAQNTILNDWDELLSKQNEFKQSELTIQLESISKTNSLYKLDTIQKRVLVGMMYSGEQEYEQAKQSLKNQTHQHFELFEVTNLPNKLAHDTLYAKFMERSSEFDYFLKLDADMVFAHENVLAEMVVAINVNGVSNLFAWVKDCPSGLMIPGIQMFRSDTKWEGSDEQLNVDYLPRTFGESRIELDQNWILHMPAPSKQQLFRYGIHKALKALQPNQKVKSSKKALLHINILVGMYRNLSQNQDFMLALMGSTLVFSQSFDDIEYNGDLAQSQFKSLEDPQFYQQLLNQTKDFWQNEIQVFYKWFDLFNKEPLLIKQVPPVNVAKSKGNRLIWITQGKLDSSLGYVSSALASTRYRVLIPAANLGPFGWQSQIVNEQDLAEHGWGSLDLNKSDIIVVSKSRKAEVAIYLQEAKQLGCRIIVDFCDNHFNDEDKAEYQIALARLADMIVTSTPELKAIVETMVDTPTSFITDCFEGQRKAPEFSPKQELKLLWFGSCPNYDTLPSLFKSLAEYAEKHKVSLDLVTLHPQGEQAAKNVSTPNLTVNYIPWSPANLQLAMSKCDLVVIPTIDADHKSGKSPNRVIEPIWAGKYVVAGYLPAYEPFTPFASIGDDLIAGIEWAISHPQEVLEKIKAGQDYIIAQHTPKLIGAKWHEVLTQVTTVQMPEKVKASTPTDDTNWAKWYNVLTQAQNSEKQLTEQLAGNQQHNNQQTGPLEPYFQAKEAARVLGLNNQTEAQIKQGYFNHYAVSQTPPTGKVAVYTAIFGGYDTAPILHYVDPNIDYILYTDQIDFDAPSPWQVRVVPAVFVDPQVDARRIKVLSHLFLADYDIAVWIDGNFTLEKLTQALVLDIASRAPVALCKHQFRNCIYEEAIEIQKRGIDATTPVLKQMQYYQARQFPAQFGLHATSFLVRNHKASQTIKMNMRWWELLSTNSKRDQLSFDYVRWENEIQVMTLPFNLRENTLYFWGKNGARKHKVDVRRNDEHEGRALNYSTIAAAVEKQQQYQPLLDSWQPNFLNDLFALNQQLIAGNQGLASTVLYDATNNHGVMSAQCLPDPRLGKQQRELLSKLCQAKRILQIGFDGGHLALMAIHYGGAKLVVVDEHLDEYKHAGFQYMSKQHAKRLTTFTKQDVLQLDAQVFDFVFVNNAPNNPVLEVSEFKKVVAKDADIYIYSNDLSLVTLTYAEILGE